jgi:hypothetical protein
MHRGLVRGLSHFDGQAARQRGSNYDQGNIQGFHRIYLDAKLEK